MDYDSNVETTKNVEGQKKLMELDQVWYMPIIPVLHLVKEWEILLRPNDL